MTLLTNQQFLFWAKFPFLVCLILAGFIYRQLTHKNNNYLTLLYWIVNPILIFVSLIVGQFEIIPVLFSLYAFLLFKKQKFVGSYLSLGVAGALKHFPFLWLPTFLIFTPLKWSKRIFLAILSTVPYLIALMLQSNAAMLSMFQFSENTKMLGLGLQLGTQLKISYYLIGYLLILFRASKQKINFKNFFETSFLLTLIYFLTTQWYIQRILWVLPFIIILSLKNPIYRFINHAINFIYFGYTLIIYPKIFDFELTRPNFYQKLVKLKRAIPLNEGLSQTIVGTLMWTILLLSGIFIFIKEKKSRNQPLSKLDLGLNLIPLLLYLGYIFSPWFLVLQ